MGTVSDNSKTHFSLLVLGKSPEMGELIDGLHEVGVEVLETAASLSDEELEETNADAVLVFEGGKAWKTCARHGIVPVLSASEASKSNIEQFNPLKEKGAGFIFEKEDKWHVFAAIMRAYETAQFPYDWKNVQKAAKKIS